MNKQEIISTFWPRNSFFIFISIWKKTCPTKEYRSTDTNYSAPMEAITQICLQFANMCQLFNNKATICDLLIFTFARATNYERQLILVGKELEYIKSQVPNLKSTNTLDKRKLEKSIEIYCNYLKELEEARIDNISSLKALYQGFLEFCKEIGIDSIHILAWLKLPELVMILRNIRNIRHQM